MEPVTLSIAVATLFFSEALKEGGKAFGKGSAGTVDQLFSKVRQKFQKAGTTGVLARAEQQPTESNIESVKRELVAQVEEDQVYANQLRELMVRLEQAGVVRQMMASGIDIDGELEVESMRQTATRGGDVQQEMLTNMKAKSIKLGDVSQES